MGRFLLGGEGGVERAVSPLHDQSVQPNTSGRAFHRGESDVPTPICPTLVSDNRDVEAVWDLVGAGQGVALAADHHLPPLVRPGAPRAATGPFCFID